MKKATGSKGKWQVASVMQRFWNAWSYWLFWLSHREQYKERLPMSIKPGQDQLLFYHMYRKIVSSVPSKERGRENNERK